MEVCPQLAGASPSLKASSQRGLFTRIGLQETYKSHKKRHNPNKKHHIGLSCFFVFFVVLLEPDATYQNKFGLIGVSW